MDIETGRPLGEGKISHVIEKNGIKASEKATLLFMTVFHRIFAFTVWVRWVSRRGVASHLSDA